MATFSKDEVKQDLEKKKEEMIEICKGKLIQKGMTDEEAEEIANEVVQPMHSIFDGGC